MHYRRGDPETGIVLILGLVTAVVLAIIGTVLIVLGKAAACEPEPITANTPTGIAGCFREGDGVASHYGPGNGVAMNFCTWELRHSTGCGQVSIQSHQTGVTVLVPVVDYCDCFTGTADERIVDLQFGVVEALGLNWEAGLYDVTVTFPEAWAQPAAEPVLLPDTAMR